MFQLFRVAWLALLFASLVAVRPPDAHAQRDDSLESMLKEANIEGRAADRTPVAKPTVSEVNRKVQWRLYKRVALEGKSGRDELAALESDARSIGHTNQTEYAMAVTFIASQQENVDVGHEMFASAKLLAPDLPYVHFAHASYAFDRDPGAFRKWATAYSIGIKRALNWPDTGIPWLLKILAYLAIAFFAAAMAFILGQTIRQIGVVSYDTARALPAGFSSNQAVVLLIAIVIVPGLLLRSPLLSLLILLLLLSIPQRIPERIVSVAIFLGIAALPRIDVLVDDLAAYAGSATESLTHAQYIYCDPACAEDLDARQIKRPDDKYIQFTRLLVAFRKGDPASLDRVVEEVSSTEWPAEIKGYAVNLKGAALVALAKPEAAIETLQEARGLLPESAAPLLNLMRAYHMMDDADQASAALKEASSRNIEEVAEFLRFERRDVNSYLAAARFPLTTFFGYHATLERDRRSLIGPVWRALAGDSLPFNLAGFIGLGGALLVFLMGFVERRNTLSTPCPKCGMARDPSEAHRTGNHSFCVPCYRTFVTGAGLDYQARVYNETILGRREKLQESLRRVLSVIAPGAGHHVAGRSLEGFLATFGMALGALFIARPLGIVRPMHELGGSNWGGFESFGWILVSIVAFSMFVAAARDIPPTTARGVK